MAVFAVAEPQSLLLHHPLGASTGYMEGLRGDWQAQVDRARRLSPFAVELSALSGDEIEGLAGYLDTHPALPFRYLSVHGPSKGLTMSEGDMVGVLASLAGLVDAIVMHPDTIEDPSLYTRLGRKLILENMDTGKQGGRTAVELAERFEELPEAGFCFDVAHAWSVDHTMTVGNELLDAFRARLRQVHVSSLSAQLHHVPLTEEDEGLFMPLLQRCVDVPWILEAPPRN